MNTVLLQSEGMNELYAVLSPELRMELAKHEQSMTVPAGTRLITRGVLPEQLVIVNSGKVQITVDCVRNSAVLDVPANGKVFGMRAVISGELPEADIISKENCRITLISRNVFLEIVRQYPQIYFAIAKVLSNDLVMAQRFLKTSSRRSRAMRSTTGSLLSWPQ
ncbi:MAG TPA: cyclic nucleotide-binding domain-containing protein [Candidatus Angelobacter sp.]|nr:cyclic nucleotide-binding domain-containing protein [Candidatus Angelobacter sp.]